MIFWPLRILAVFSVIGGVIGIENVCAAQFGAGHNSKPWPAAHRAVRIFIGIIAAASLGLLAVATGLFCRLLALLQRRTQIRCPEKLGVVARGCETDFTSTSFTRPPSSACMTSWRRSPTGSIAGSSQGLLCGACTAERNSSAAPCASPDRQSPDLRLPVRARRGAGAPLRAEMSTLTYIFGWPLARGVVAGVRAAQLPRRHARRRGLRHVHLGGAGGEDVRSIHRCAHWYRRFQVRTANTVGAYARHSYHVGVDGINVGLILMGAIVAFAAACVSWEIKDREKEFYILLLVMTGGILGAFASLDLFFFYFFHELALVPTFIMIGVWGRGERKNYATFQITLYLSIGALIALIGLIALYVQSGANTFDIPTLTARVQPKPAFGLDTEFHFPAAAVRLWHSGFALAVPHLGAAGLRLGSDRHGHAACRRAEEIRSVRSDSRSRCRCCRRRRKAGCNPRVALPRQPRLLRLGGDAAERFQLAHRLFQRGAHGLCFPRHRDLEPHRRDRRGAGDDCARIPRGADVRLERFILQQTGTLEMENWAACCADCRSSARRLIMAAFAGCGLPGFANFAGEITVFFGAWNTFRTVTVLACWGALIIGAVYMLRAIRDMLHGPVPEKWAEVTDAATVA